MKLLIFPLIFFTASYCAFGQSSTTSDIAGPPQRLELFEISLYNVEPFLDSALELSDDKFDIILSARAAYRSDPALSEAKAAVASASAEERTALNQKRKEIQKAALAVYTAVVDANLSPEAKTLVEFLNAHAKEQRKLALKDSGISGLTEHDPQFEETKKKASELERQYLAEVIASTLSESQKTAIRNARGEDAPKP